MSDNERIQILKSFRRHVVQFLDELIGQFPHEADLIIIRIFIKDQAPLKDLMAHFMRELLPLKNKVAARDVTFFLEHDILFREFDPRKVMHFKTLWRSPTLDCEDRKVIWQWFDSFIYLAEKYRGFDVPVSESNETPVRANVT